MNIIDHLSLGVPDIDEASDFYDGLMEVLGYPCLAKADGFVAYGAESVQFLIMKPADGEGCSAGNGTHICFVASERNRVDAFHRFAIESGGTCEGEPGPRPGYPKADVYTAFVRDPVGNKLEAIHNGFAAQ